MAASSEETWSIDQAAGDVPGQWQRMLSATHLPWATSIPPWPGGVFEASARRWWIDDLALVDCECGPCSGTRQRRQLANTADEFVVVLITRAGRETVSQGGVEAELRPGDAVAWDSTRPARFTVTEPLVKRSLLIPRAALDEVSGRSWVRAGVALEGSSPATELLTSYLDVLSRSLDRLGPAAVTAARNATLELFIGAVRGDAEAAAGGTGTALRAAMDRYIERHLLDQPVSATALAHAHGVSVRTVNRVFNATGQTVSEVVRVRRLARARDEVADGSTSIAAIATRWGFADSSHFSRAFKAHYGSSPTEYREATGSGRGAPVRGAPVRGAPVHRPVARVQARVSQPAQTGAIPVRS